MRHAAVPRYCRSCGGRLARDNPAAYCGPCGRTLVNSGPLELPQGFWDADLLRDALASGHMGRVIAAYRSHPHHGRPLLQKTVAAWALMSQPQLSRLENGPPVRDMDKLVFWARRLRIPPISCGSNFPSAPSGNQPPAADH